ncbi:Endocytosis and vacuole integrity protein [Knufia obscura]|uniref:Endocytosis and vacuole integrity protein n=1 Tax=Knufia obscura TaxID=1635080 RepID=A0ABR0S2I0_9EURO|nr:Endocytosis and vacuole integrity protein [Knufia obscura]
MTAAFLQSELTTLISDSKRKHSEIKTAAEKSLSELRSISVTSETQVAGDLVRKSHFIDPFVLACKSQNVKIASSGATSLQRLVASTAIPRSRLPDVLQAFEQAVPLGLDVQLKVLQTLPSLLQLYAADLHGEALSRTLSVSADLSSSKLPMVSSTAGATFQQLVSAVFTRAVANGKSTAPQRSEDKDSARTSEDAFAIFIDLCALLTEDQPQFVRLENLPPLSALETLEGLLSTHGTFVLDDSDSLKACSGWLIPGLSTLIDSSANFGVVVRALRIAFILSSRHLLQVKPSVSELFRIILRICDRPGSQKWKRLLGLEFFRGFCSDFDALRTAFAAFDLEKGSIGIISDLMSTLVRTASEDPSLIGLGRQSTIPSSKPTEAGNDVAAAADVPIGSVTQVDAPSAGVSAEMSTVSTPCLDLYDRSNPPEVPDTYVYTLVLGCVSSFSDGLSKFIMPLSVPNRKASKADEAGVETAGAQEIRRRSSLRDASATQKYQHLVNPLTRRDLGRISSVQVCAKMIEACWPAVLATCSTFLNSALDSYFYHMLIRTVQKLTQVSGVMELNTPRDALLTTLAKVSVPANISNLMNTFYGGTQALKSETGLSMDGEEASIKSPIASTPRQSVDMTVQTLNVRNLLCLRALLNLGIALGPTLSRAAWTIIMQALEQIDALMSVGPNARLAQTVTLGAGPTDGGSTLAGEISAVDTARRRMVESTKTYPSLAFKFICEALLNMIEDVIPLRTPHDGDQGRSNGSLRPSAQRHKSTRSVSGTWAKTDVLEVEVQFVLKTLGRLAHVNLYRFRDQGSGPVSWDLIVANLLLLQSNQRLQSHLRLQSANIIDAIVVDTCTASSEEDNDGNEDGDTLLTVLKYGIPALGKQLESARSTLSTGSKSSDADVKIVQAMLEALHNLIGSRGEELGKGWAGVFAILDMAVTETGNAREALYPSAFKVAQLVVSDFLTTLDNNSTAALLDLFDAFGSQKLDLNMSLTTIALYWNVGALVTEDAESLDPLAATESREAEEPAVQAYSKSDLWQKLVYSLDALSRDARPDSRNAAARMLTKTVDASVLSMTSQTLNSCFTRILLPLIEFYAAKCSDGDDTWQLSVFNLLKDLIKIIQSHGSLVLVHSTFDDTWLQLVHSMILIFNIGDISMTTAAIDALADITGCMRQLDNAEGFHSSPTMLMAVWDFWKDHCPANIDFAGPNQTALASHARLWLEMAAWNSEALATLESAAAITAQVVKASAFAAQHETYTIDVNRVSVDQEQLLQILHNLKRLQGIGKRFYTQLLVDIARGMTARTMSMSQQSPRPKPDAKGVRQPTGIAFATGCIKELREVLQEEAQNANIWRDAPIEDILELSGSLTATKYSTLPMNNKDPIWQKACLLGVDCAVVASRNCQSGTADIGTVRQPIYDLLAAILGAHHLEALEAQNTPSEEKIAADGSFDMVQLQRLHAAMKSIFDFDTVSQPFQKECILTLFNYSLVARPWYNDLTADLENDPLKHLTTIRRGSIRSPDLPARRQMYKQALQCLFDYASQAPNRRADLIPPMASLAAQYILLRLSHTLKTFIADQPLRYLEHPHMALQEELHFVLRTFLDLRVNDDAFVQPARYLGCGERLNKDEEEQDVSGVIRNDGKSHLRIMWGFITRFEELWYQLPRLKKGHAWQDHEHGRAIEQCLKEWKETVSEKWGPRFG